MVDCDPTDRPARSATKLICGGHLYHPPGCLAARSFHRILRVALIVRGSVPAQPTLVLLTEAAIYEWNIAHRLQVTGQRPREVRCALGRDHLRCVPDDRDDVPFRRDSDWAHLNRLRIPCARTRRLSRKYRPSPCATRTRWRSLPRSAAGGGTPRRALPPQEHRTAGERARRPGEPLHEIGVCDIESAERNQVCLHVLSSLEGEIQVNEKYW
jgi:hypothetical protein